MLLTEDAIINADFVVAQLEVPIPAIISAFEIAKAHGVLDSINWMRQHYLMNYYH